MDTKHSHFNTVHFYDPKHSHFKHSPFPWTQNTANLNTVHFYGHKIQPL